MSQTPEQGQSFMMKLATFIVDKRNLFFLITVLALIFSAFARNWVEVESDLTTYLPNSSETKQALEIMEQPMPWWPTSPMTRLCA